MSGLTAVFIGNESLTLQCAEIWLARGHSIAAMVTRNPDVRAWAASRGITAETHDAGLAGRLGGIGVDWLLSVANLAMISPALRAVASRGAVNFHDGPLPAYAGLNAPVWALLRGEAQHGITWHLIDDGVDDGDILEQRLFDISETDTALTLNTKAYEAALESFPALAVQLETGLQRRKQDFSQRSAFLRADRPACFGRLDFGQSAEQVARMVRALDHGRYWNPLTTAKIATEQGVLNVGSAEVVAQNGTPGQVLGAGQDGLIVACAQGAVRLGRLTCQSRGLPVDTAGMTDTKLPAIDNGQALTDLLARIAPHEARMRQRLAQLNPLVVAAAPATRDAPQWLQLPLNGDLALLALALAHVGGQIMPDIALCVGAGVAGYSSDWIPVTIQTTGSRATAEAALREACAVAPDSPGFALDLMTRDSGLTDLPVPQVAVSHRGQPLTGSVLTLGENCLWVDQRRMTKAEAAALAARLEYVAAAIAAMPADAPLADAPLLSPEEEHLVLHDGNQTLGPRLADLCCHTAIEQQAARSPDAPAVSFEATTLTYAQLNARANRAAHVLMQMGVTQGTLVGLHCRRSLEMLIGALAIQKAGGAYVPMDPAYPADRTALYIEDSACPVIVTQLALSQSLAAGLPKAVQTLCLDNDGRLASATDTNPISGVTPADLAYMIYTSGSTGRPKGVMVEHRNVVNFFIGMDRRIGTDPGTWLAVTSMSFDISVLELFWTLARGFKVVISSDENRALVSSGKISSAQKMDFSIYYWGNDDGAGPKKYELLLEGAKFADTHGFVAVWTPERHFHAFGGPYPNPSVTGAAVAAVTRNIGVRAGSCVVPLHHPARIAEEWAVIDNLTNGRAGMAIASGWHPDDFVLRPENTPPANKAAMYAAAEQVRALWRGEGVDFPTANGGTFTVKTQPRPVSKELPLWVTTAGNPETWREAGQLGANVLTHLLGQSVEEVADKIKLYHAALREAGHDPASHTVTLMLHTYIARDRDHAREVARGPMKDYLRSAAGLIKQYAWAFPAFKKPQGVAKPMDIDIQTLSPDELEGILDFAFQRYFEDSGLFGTVEDALARVEQLKRIGVGEVACLIDYGIPVEKVMEGLYPLAEIVRRANAGGGVEDGDYSIAAQLIRHKVTHLQCTPSMARMIAMNEDSRHALGGVKTIMVGGEALPGGLVQDLRKASPARLLNMYGPTETTIWSSVEEVGSPEPITNIGTPLTNQQMYVLDQDLRPVAPGTEGELWIGGDGVTRGYWQRPDLTADRFRPDPFVTPERATPWGARMYRTGDLVRRRADGKLDFIGRADHQVKLRGYRIELGEIEAVLEAQPGVTQAVVLAREDSPGDLRLVAYLTGTAHETALRAELAAVLPDHMLPAHFVPLAAFPLTPNRKVDRKALPAPQARQAAPAAYVAPASDVEGQIAQIWQRVLGIPRVSAKDNFFALGGHSLLAVQVHREIREALGATRLSITDIFRFPTLSALAQHLDDRPKAAITPAAPQNFQPAIETRAEARGDAMARRRAMRAGRMGTDG